MLYDYIYVDAPKIASLYSQLIGGLVEVRESTRQTAQVDDNKRRYDFKVFQHNAGGSSEETTGVKEVIKPHHALFKELEDELYSQGYLVDLSPPGSPALSSIGLRNRLKGSLCIKVHGRVVVEDYERMKMIARSFSDIADFINMSSLSNMGASELVAELNEAETQLSKSRSVKQKKQAQDRVDRIRNGMAEYGAIDTSLVPEWLVDGLTTWIDTFMSGIVNIRVYPSVDRPSEHVFGHLNPQFFQDSTLDSFHFTYGSKPTEDFSLLGVISSVPTEDEDGFDSLAEFVDRELRDFESVENGFRGLFKGYDGVEAMIRTCRYPRVMVYPLMVYRSVAPSNTT